MYSAINNVTIKTHHDSLLSAPGRNTFPQSNQTSSSSFSPLPGLLLLWSCQICEVKLYLTYGDVNRISKVCETYNWWFYQCQSKYELPLILPQYPDMMPEALWEIKNGRAQKWLMKKLFPTKLQRALGSIVGNVDWYPTVKSSVLSTHCYEERSTATREPLQTGLLDVL